MTTVYVSIGNSDDKLTQAQWSGFAADFVRIATEEFDTSVHGIWFSRPDDAYQNACVCFEADSGTIADIKDEMGWLAEQYGQDSIAWAEAPVTEFIGVVKEQPS